MDLPPERRGNSARRTVSPNRGFAFLWLAAVLVPLLGVAGAGVASWQAVEQDAAARTERTVELLRQNALRAFGAQEAILVATARAMAGRRPEELREDLRLHALLQELTTAGAPVISGVLVTDPAGQVVSASYEFPARPVDLSTRDYVRALNEGHVRRAVGEPVDARPMGWPIIPVARRAPPPHEQDEEEGGGVVVSSFSPGALTAFYASVAETPRDLVAMVRSDGAVLARHPPIALPTTPEQRRQVVRMLERLLPGPARPLWLESPHDAVPRLVVARSVGDWPVAVAYGMDGATLRAAWRERMVAPAAGGAAAMALLLALTAMAQRGARREREQAESRAEAEAQLARAGRAAAIGLLAAGLAHDVKNLVQSVRSGARVMQRRAEDPGEVRRCAELLGDAAERGGRLVNAMLAFARDGATPDAAPPPLEVAPVLAELSELLGRTLGSAWPVRLALPPGLPPALGDRAGFEAAVVNLAANARDAMPAGGVVAISARVEQLDQPAEEAGLRAGRYVVTAVSDTGVGMDAETLRHLGEPFFSTKGPGAGTGLGLATVRGFCARAGGALRFESSPGRGTTAALWLPLAG